MLGNVKILSGPSAAARNGRGFERCCLDRQGGRAPRLGQARGPVLHIRSMYKIDRGGKGVVGGG